MRSIKLLTNFVIVNSPKMTCYFVITHKFRYCKFSQNDILFEAFQNGSIQVCPRPDVSVNSSDSTISKMSSKQSSIKSDVSPSIVSRLVYLGCRCWEKVTRLKYFQIIRN